MEIYRKMIKSTHVLIAGQTGSGKSVLINGFLSALHQSRQPFQTVLIDPKGLELSGWSGLDTCICYEDTDPVSALQVACGIMEANFRAVKQAGKRAYTGLQTYVVIDELAPLMFQSKKAVLPLLEHIGNLGRAGGVHLVMCTQSPARSVIPASVQINCDLCIGLKCKSSRESKMIVNNYGCESLRIGQCICSDDGKMYNIPMCPDSIQRKLQESHKRITPPPVPLSSWLDSFDF